MNAPDRSAEDLRQEVAPLVHEAYWEKRLNCALISLTLLGRLFDVPVEAPVLAAAGGLNGAGRFQAQCGLVEGPMMFLGLLGARHGLNHKAVGKWCYRYADSFQQRFGSLNCRVLRGGPFSPQDKPYACEGLTVDSICHAYAVVQTLLREHAQNA
ncbi:C-GCAxxG-C-C family protein [uncultured Desulfovibrio sp.]|uniref:C-GCAxxG-C-C family protein n=1 Tax=uncultured Desulfovibrio sp. TaxID=167968 RepID=UPI00262CE826|nr:C-GCAxxG-C-C family protein [uncultured Desulfovibrio sp.]